MSPLELMFFESLAILLATNIVLFLLGTAFLMLLMPSFRDELGFEKWWHVLIFKQRK